MKEEDKGKETEKALVPEVVGAGALVEQTPEEMKAQLVMMNEKRKIFQQFVKDQIKPDVHSFTIPGSNKPSLSKPGGLLLCGLYQVVPKYETRDEIFGKKGEYEAFVICRLVSAKTGQIVAEGQGSCSTQEVKYKYRWLWERDVPKDMDKGVMVTRTTKGGYKQYRILNEELEDTHNTVLKMAQKRAMVAASLNLPFASEAFTQDIEETKTHEPKETESEKPKPTAEPGKEAPAAASESQPESSGNDKTITGPQVRKLYAKFKFTGFDDEARHALLKEWYPDSEGHVFDEKSSKWLTLKQASELIETFEKGSDILTKWLKDFQEKQGK